MTLTASGRHRTASRRTPFLRSAICGAARHYPVPSLKSRAAVPNGSANRRERLRTGVARVRRGRHPCEGGTRHSRCTEGVSERTPDESARCTGSRGTLLRHREEESRYRWRSGPGRREAHRSQGARLASQWSARWATSQGFKQAGSSGKNLALKHRQGSAAFRPSAALRSPSICRNHRSSRFQLAKMRLTTSHA
jgi:hypothetical protein